MLYVVIHDKDGDAFTYEFETKGEAIIKAQRTWGLLTKYEQAKSVVTAIKSINPDEDAENHFDGVILWESPEI